MPDIVCGPLKVFDLQYSIKVITRFVQAHVFVREISVLKTENVGVLSKVLHSSGYLSPLRKLASVLADGIIRVGGRMDKAPTSNSSRHPIILPRKHHVTELIIKHYHNLEGHVGCNQVFATIRQKCCILQGPAAVKGVVGECLTCQRWNTLPSG